MAIYKFPIIIVIIIILLYSEYSKLRATF